MNQGNFYAGGQPGIYGGVQPGPGRPGYGGPGVNPMYGNPGMVAQNNVGGGMPFQPSVGGNPQQIIQEKERQIQQLKSQYPNVQHKHFMDSNQPLDLVEITMQIQTPQVNLQIPIALIINAQFPLKPPKVFIKSKLKHNLFEIKDQTIELDANNVVQWNPQQTNLLDFMNKVKVIFEKDPPKQEKIIEDVNRLLSVVTEQNFRDLVGNDNLGQRSVDDLRQLQGISFQELICSSQEYKRIGQNLVDVINFNEKTASIPDELLQKKDDLEQHKQSLLLVADTIETLSKEHNGRIAKCKQFKDAFSRQNIEAFVHKELKSLDSESLNLESIAQTQQGNMLDVLQSYFDTRKNFHRVNVIKTKLPELKYQ